MQILETRSKVCGEKRMLNDVLILGITLAVCTHVNGAQQPKSSGAPSPTFGSDFVYGTPMAHVYGEVPYTVRAPSKPRPKGC